MRKYLIIKIIIILISTIILTLSIYGLIVYFNNGPFNPEYAKILYPPFIGVYVSTLLIYLCLFNIYRVIKNIEKKQGYSLSTYRYIVYIQLFSFQITIIYLFISYFIYKIADMDDAPGLILINILILLVSIIIYAGSLLLSRHVKEVIEDREFDKEL